MVSLRSLSSLVSVGCVALLAVYSALASSSMAKAEFLLTNLAADDSLNTAGGLAAFETSGAISIGFKVLVPTTLTAVDLRLRANTGSSASKDATLVLRDDVNGNPGTKLVDFSTVTLGTSFQSASFSPTANISLTAGSTYWLTLGTTIVAGGNGDGLVAAARNPAVNPSGSDGEFVGLRFGSPEIQVSSPFFTDAPSIQIQGITAVPEPTVVGLFLGLATVLGWRERHSRKRQEVD